MAYTTKALIKTRLSIGQSNTVDDDFIDALILQGQTLIDQETRGYRPGELAFEATTATRTFDAQRRRDGGDIGNDGRSLWLRGLDLLTVSALTNGDGTTISASDYVLEPRQFAPYYAITLKRGVSAYWNWSSSPEGAISVAGTWGYSTSAPPTIKGACEEAVVYWYKSAEQGGNDGQARQTSDGGYIMPSRLPKDVSDKICVYRRRI